jgi:hypothetical protein
MQTFGSLICKIQSNILFARLFWAGCQALFGLLPVFVLDNSLHYTFYSSTLIISYIGMSMLGINGIANLRWARSRLDAKRAKPYFNLVLFCGMIVAILYSLFVKFDYFTGLLISAGLLQNIKTLSISYLRNLPGKHVLSFMFKDSFFCILGSIGLFFIDSEFSLIILMSIVYSGGLFFILPLLTKVFSFKIKSFKWRSSKNMYLILKDGLNLFCSTLFITYIPIIARTAVDMTQSENFFVNFSVALSIAINIQKVSLTYFWVIQKKYWSRVSTGIKEDESFFKILVLILSTCISIYFGQLIFDAVNPHVAFPIEVMALTIIITIHRMAVSYYRLHLLTVMSVFEIFKNQLILTVCLFVLFLVLFTLLGLNYLISYVVIFVIADLIFVNHIALSRRTKS